MQTVKKIQNASTWKERNKLNATDLRFAENTPTQLPLCQRPLALKLPLCCPIFFGIVLITGPSECRVTVNFELNWIYFILFAMAPNGFVSQLLALVQWRARAHARVTLVHDCGHHDDDGDSTWRSLSKPASEAAGVWPAARTLGSLSGLDCLKLATTKWPTWDAILGL